MTEPRKLRVFLCHASQDKPVVRELHQRLKKEGWIDSWLDEEKLNLGQHWAMAIEEALDAADLVLIFLSRNSVSKEGFVQRELNHAWDISLEKPRGVIFLIPLRLDECQVPRYLASRQWGDYFGGRKESTYEFLLQSLKSRHEQKLRLEADEQAQKDEATRIQKEAEDKIRRKREATIRRETEARVRKEMAEAEARQQKEADEKVRRKKQKFLPKEIEGRFPQQSDEPAPASVKANPSIGDLGASSAADQDAVMLWVQDPAAKQDAKAEELLTYPDERLDEPPKLAEQANAVDKSTSTDLDKSDEQDAAMLWLETIAAKQGAKTGELLTYPDERSDEPPKWVEQTKKAITLSNGMKFMPVPAGPFLMGSSKENKLAWDGERPQHTVELPYDYWMARYPVTNELYNAYVEAKGIKHPISYWGGSKNHPVWHVNWQDAMQYCQWLNNLLKGELPAGLILRLPTEAEWEKAARGNPSPREAIGRGQGEGEAREWPWGNEFDKNKCNSSEGGKGETTPVGLYSPQGDSPYGCADMAGNMWEWCHSLYKPYPYKANDGREDKKASGRRVVRGGAFDSNDRYARCAYRNLNLYNDGLRVAASPILS